MTDLTPGTGDVAIFVSIGTDVHPFERMIDWVDEFLEQNPALADSTLVQHGPTRPTRLARNRPYLDYEDLMDTFRRATVVVSHGGPATIFEARAHGHLPIVVPRNPDHGEHVDGHQQRFARHLADDGLVALCEEKEAFFRTLQGQLANPGSATVSTNDARLHQTMANLDAAVRGLVPRPPLWRRIRAKRPAA